MPHSINNWHLCYFGWVCFESMRIWLLHFIITDISILFQYQNLRSSTLLALSAWCIIPEKNSYIPDSLTPHNSLDAYFRHTGTASLLLKASRANQDPSPCISKWRWNIKDSTPLTLNTFTERRQKRQFLLIRRAVFGSFISRHRLRRSNTAYWI